MNINKQNEENQCASSEGLRARVQRKANDSATDAARHERLAAILTPEIEAALWCWQECLALGLISIQVIADAVAREDRRRREFL